MVSDLVKWHTVWKPSSIRLFWHQFWGGYNGKYLLEIFFNAAGLLCTSLSGLSHIGLKVICFYKIDKRKSDNQKYITIRVKEMIWFTNLEIHTIGTKASAISCNFCPLHQLCKTGSFNIYCQSREIFIFLLLSTQSSSN